ncbi:class I SAM-dependent methyltransferase [Leptolyngbya sp. BC1307]|uniref:class I SAM-dependent methyltransferase n=1 Tax=Leptolyngbya sp. BC1307 TaxID=2029589 RepID=UPI000EFD0575|nr:class I SAM-dependent methyltransferase [Leptolyngbya sp. BC1307]
MDATQDNPWYAWYAAFDETHSPEERQQWYSQAAQAYRWARPRYPEAIIEQVIARAGLNAQSTLLEIGCGPGIATADFAKKGLTITGIEPSATACALARQACKAYPSVSIHNSTFENYPLNQKYDAVLAATCFHWISPGVACTKSAAALNPGGSLILLWATPPQPSAELCQYLQPVYDRYKLSDMGQEHGRSEAYYQGNFETFAKMLNTSGFFQPSSVAIQSCQSIYSIEKYLALLSTLSGYIALEAQTRENLLTDLGARLAEKLETGALTTTHWFASQVAPLLTD